MELALHPWVIEEDKKMLWSAYVKLYRYQKSLSSSGATRLPRTAQGASHSDTYHVCQAYSSDPISKFYTPRLPAQGTGPQFIH